MNFEIISDPGRIQSGKWSEFVDNHPNGNIFQSPAMFSIYGSLTKYIPIVLFCVYKGNIHGMLLAAIQKYYSGLMGKFSTRSIIYGGPLVDNSDVMVLNRLIEAYDDIIKGKAIYTQFRNTCDMHWAEKSLELKGYSYEDHLNFIFDLTKGADVLWTEIQSTRRKQIKRGYKRGLTCEILQNPTLNQIELMYKIFKGIYHKAKLPLPDNLYFQRMHEGLHSRSELKIFVAKYNDEIVGSRWVLCSQKTIFDWYAGSLSEHYDKYPNDILPWEVLRWGSQNGFNTFDFGGAGKPNVPYGVRDYKKKFGGEVVNFGRFEKIHSKYLMNIASTGLKFWQAFKTN